MKRKNLITLSIFSLILMLFFSGCANRVQTNGYFVDKYLVEQKILPNHTTEATVIKNLGSPTVMSSFGDRTFYYMGRKYNKKAFLNPVLIDQMIVAISFDDDHRVKEIKHYNDAKEIEYDNTDTPFKGNDMSALEQLLGNIGRFNTPSSRKPGL